ncbi:hypothetical protein ATSB10_10210 [Dyella thiooxydans]|uniref:Uncharacterized protein n=1 Tax=Dyella thiooxydans TaxID=445710 RepID=A0A169GQH7_9GAMM|nr:hypothetical protein ATSB10_10210 [Dyella thiooxydans]
MPGRARRSPIGEPPRQATDALARWTRMAWADVAANATSLTEDRVSLPEPSGLLPVSWPSTHVAHHDAGGVSPGRR